MKTEKMKIARGSGNVFADLGRPDAEAHMLKAELVTRIDKIVRQRGFKEVEAAFSSTNKGSISACLYNCRLPSPKGICVSTKAGQL